jgi:DNA-binding transcriptional LysR family regulator
MGAPKTFAQSIVSIETICISDSLITMFDAFRHFILVAEHGTFTDAARAAHLSQPALSASIKKLEQDVSASLFIRNARGAELSAAGRVLLPKAREALASVKAGQLAVSELLGLSYGQVRIVAGATVCTYYLPKFIALFRKAYPKVQIALREANTTAALASVESGESDLGIVCSEIGEPWQKDELVLVTYPKGPFSPRKVKVDQAPFITFPKGSTTREILGQTFPSANVVMELSSISAIKSNLRTGIGVSLLSEYAIARDLKSRTLAIIPDPRTPIKRTLSIVHRGVKRLSPAGSAFYEILKGA